LSEILPPSGLGLGTDEVSQKGLKLLHLWCHSQKIQNQKNCFHCRLQTCWVFWGLDQLFSACSPEDIPMQRHVQTAGFRLKTYQKPRCCCGVTVSKI